MKYLITLILFSFLIVNCNPSEPFNNSVSSASKRPVISTLRNTVLYKEEAYRIDTLFGKL